MKSLFFKLFVIIFISPIFSQQTDSLVLKEDVSYNLLKSDSIKYTGTQDSLLLQKRNDSLKSLLFSEKWDSVNFNPYRNQPKKYPFQIEFVDSTYASPVPRKKVITSHYGWRRGRPHRGIDIDLVSGDSVMTMFEGIVRFARYSTGHGKTIVVRHNNGLETAYAHLSKYLVKVNDTIKKGQIIGLGGTTGNARGSHLHLVVSYNGNYINPEYLFDFGQKNKLHKQSTWVTKNWVSAHYHTSKKQSNLLFYDNYEDALAYQEKLNKRKIYVVKRGDTLSEISSKYRISLSKLCKANSISINSTLKIGKKLIIN